MLNSVYSQNTNVITRHIAGETILVPIQGSLADMQKVHVLNDTGEFIWGNLDGISTLSQILDSMTDAFELDRAQGEKDLLEFVDSSKQAELILEK